MKTLINSILWVFLFQGLSAYAQSNNLPYAELYTLDGVKTDTRAISNDDMPLIMVMWKTYDNKCCENLFVICDAWKEKLEKRGVKMVAICVDCVGKTDHIKPFVYGHDIEAEVYIDKNGDFKRKMGLSDGPYTILFDREMNIYCEYSGYCTGVGEALCDKMNKCLDGIAMVE